MIDEEQVHNSLYFISGYISAVDDFESYLKSSLKSMETIDDVEMITEMIAKLLRKSAKKLPEIIESSRGEENDKRHF